MDNENREITSANSMENSSVDSKEIGLLPLVYQVKDSVLIHTRSKIEELEYKLLEKDELIQTLQLELKNVKSLNEEQSIELHKMKEEISASKAVLEQFLETLSNR